MSSVHVNSPKVFVESKKDKEHIHFGLNPRSGEVSSNTQT
jgi:hypothetical protein